MPVGVPSSNPGLPFRAGGFASLAEGLDYAARGETGFCFFGPRGTLETALSYAELRERALDLAARLGSLGLGRGERVALVAETDGDFVSLFFACQYAGLVPAPLPLPINFAGHAPYVARLAAACCGRPGRAPRSARPSWCRSCGRPPPRPARPSSGPSPSSRPCRPSGTDRAARRARRPATSSSRPAARASPWAWWSRSGR